MTYGLAEPNTKIITIIYQYPFKPVKYLVSPKSNIKDQQDVINIDGKKNAYRGVLPCLSCVLTEHMLDWRRWAMERKLPLEAARWSGVAPMSSWALTSAQLSISIFTIWNTPFFLNDQAQYTGLLKIN